MRKGLGNSYTFFTLKRKEFLSISLSSKDISFLSTAYKALRCCNLMKDDDVSKNTCSTWRDRQTVRHMLKSSLWLKNRVKPVGAAGSKVVEIEKEVSSTQKPILSSFARVHAYVHSFLPVLRVSLAKLLHVV